MELFGKDYAEIIEVLDSIDHLLEFGGLSLHLYYYKAREFLCRLYFPSFKSYSKRNNSVFLDGNNNVVEANQCQLFLMFRGPPLHLW